MLPNLKTGAVEQCRSLEFWLNLHSLKPASLLHQMPICYDGRKARPEGRRGLGSSLNGVQKCNWPRFVCSRQSGSSSVSRSKFSIRSHYTAPMNNCAFGLRFERWKWWASFIFPPPSGSQSELKVSPAPFPPSGWQAQIHLFPAPPASAGASGKESRQIQTPQGEGQSTPHSWHVQFSNWWNMVSYSVDVSLLQNRNIRQMIT